MLSQIAQGEAFLRSYGFKEVRVRHHGKTARIEIARPELTSFVSSEMVKKIGRKMKTIGFDRVGLDLAGYTTGIFNN
jgi:uncharacterized protein